MSLFLITFFFLYGGLHVYVFVKVWHAVNMRWPAGVVLALVFLLMVLAPVAIRILERNGQDGLARLVAYLGYSWMGFVFIFFSISILLDLLRVIFFGLSQMLNVHTPFGTSTQRAFFIIPLAGSVLLGCWGLWEASDINLTTFQIRSSKIPHGIDKITIAQISDVHLGLLVRERKLKQISRLIKQANPDLLV